MVKLADTQVLEACTERCAGSSPAPGILYLLNPWQAKDAKITGAGHLVFLKGE